VRDGKGSPLSDPRRVHLVGSVPLADAAEVFRTVAETVGDLIRRFPDGETGPRKEWVQWQKRILDEHPQIELTEDKPLVFEQRDTRPYYRLKNGVAADDLAFGPLGYAECARASYAEFRKLRSAGVIAGDARFLVAIPSPLAFLNVLVAADHRAAIEGPYMERLLMEVDEIVAAIPHGDLAMQWDAVIENLILEGVRTSNIDDSPEALVGRLARIGDRVPPAVELGYHLCYGDMNHRHSLEPPDTRVMVDVANRLGRVLHRPLNYLHMPVPRNRADEAYFAPLRELALPETEIFLGLVHYTDGVDGTRRRIDAAATAIGDFGIATECGFGRRQPETILPLLEIHAACARG
jgi:methionine synthase II (cobalamin-independent)